MKVKPPKYYDKLYDAEKHEEFEKLRKLRKKDAERVTNLQYIQSTLLKKESLINQEKTKNGQISSLKRK